VNPFTAIDVRTMSDEDWIRIAYIALLQRKIDDIGLDYWLQRVKSGSFNYKDLIDTLIQSPEYIMHYRTPFNSVLHQVRVKWVSSLPHFSKILDIGGSSPNISLGAMIELGYPHRPQKLIIFDLPPEKQYWGKPKYEQQESFSFAWGEIYYIYGYAEQIQNSNVLKKERFDCIFMGQTIEHVEKQGFENLLIWILDHLADEGRFIFDTPNRQLTSIQSPYSWIDKDHKYEYTPSELEGLLNKYGFNVTRKWGFLHMPETLKNQVFNPLEVYETERINDRPDESYCFGFECCKKN
jgi:SAM-dependent methyltransferase